MGRGIGTRQVLPLLEIPDRHEANFLKLTFVQGTVLSIIWRGAEATLTVVDPLFSLRDMLVPVTREELAGWLQRIEACARERSASNTLGPFSLAWNSTDTAPSLFTYNGRQGKLLVGRLASWNVLLNFLQEAHTKGLF